MGIPKSRYQTNGVLDVPGRPGLDATADHHSNNDIDLSFLDPPIETGDLGRMAHYRVTKVLGIGGMGVVLKAEDTHLRRTVALKVMRQEYIESYTSRERFLQEARVAAQLDSEYIATVYQVGMHNDVPFLAMQYLQGETLDERLEAAGAMRLPEALMVARQAGTGLTTAHHLGLVHRDVKPANIWLEYEPNGRTLRRAKVLDFGLARVLDSSRKLTNMGTIIGTPQFMAPEQASGLPACSRADIFSLGAVMYVMLTGRLPFDAPTAPALLMALVSHHPPRVRELVQTIPQEIDDLIHRMMMKDPADRPASMVDVVDTIDLTLIEMSGSYPAQRSGPLGFETTKRMIPPSPPTGPQQELACTVELHPLPQVGMAPLTAAVIELPTATLPIIHLPALPPPPPIPTPSLFGRPRRRNWRSIGWAVAVVAMTAVGAIFGNRLRPTAAPSVQPVAALTTEVRVGLLFSKNGPLRAMESSLMDATILAIDDLNEKGGVLGRRVVPVEEDAGRTTDDYARAADRLVKERGVQAVFGVVGSADRRAVRPVIERNNAVLFFAAGHEGMERSSRIVSTGPTLSQTTLPTVRHLLSQGVKKFALVGCENIATAATVAAVTDVVEAAGGQVVCAPMIGLDEKDHSAALRTLRAARPDVVLTMFRNRVAVSFVRQYRESQPALAAKLVHLVQLEDLDTGLSPNLTAGDWVATAALAAPTPTDFTARFRAKYGANRTVTDTMAAAYTAVQLWATAAEKAQSTAPDAVLAAVPTVTVDGPFGTVRTAGPTLHVWHRLRLFEYCADGTRTVIHTGEVVPPELYPPSRLEREWELFAREQFLRWDEHWRKEPR